MKESEEIKSSFGLFLALVFCLVVAYLGFVWVRNSVTQEREVDGLIVLPEDYTLVLDWFREGEYERVLNKIREFRQEEKSSEKNIKFRDEDKYKLSLLEAAVYFKKKFYFKAFNEMEIVHSVRETVFSLTLRGQILEKINEIELAEQSYKKANNIKDYFPSYEKLGMLYYRRGNLEAAISVFEQANHIKILENNEINQDQEIKKIRGIGYLTSRDLALMDRARTKLKLTYLKYILNNPTELELSDYSKDFQTLKYTEDLGVLGSLLAVQGGVLLAHPALERQDGRDDFLGKDTASLLNEATLVDPQNKNIYQLLLGFYYISVGRLEASEEKLMALRNVFKENSANQFIVFELLGDLALQKKKYSLSRYYYKVANKKLDLVDKLDFLNNIESGNKIFFSTYKEWLPKMKTVEDWEILLATNKLSQQAGLLIFLDKKKEKKRILDFMIALKRNLKEESLLLDKAIADLAFKYKKYTKAEQFYREIINSPQKWDLSGVYNNLALLILNNTLNLKEPNFGLAKKYLIKGRDVNSHYVGPLNYNLALLYKQEEDMLRYSKYLLQAKKWLDGLGEKRKLFSEEKEFKRKLYLELSFLYYYVGKEREANFYLEKASSDNR